MSTQHQEELQIYPAINSFPETLEQRLLGMYNNFHAITEWPTPLPRLPSSSQLAKTIEGNWKPQGHHNTPKTIFFHLCISFFIFSFEKKHRECYFCKINILSHTLCILSTFRISGFLNNSRY